MIRLYSITCVGSQLYSSLRLVANPSTPAHVGVEDVGCDRAKNSYYSQELASFLHTNIEIWLQKVLSVLRCLYIWIYISNMVNRARITIFWLLCVKSSVVSVNMRPFLYDILLRCAAGLEGFQGVCLLQLTEIQMGN